jgi:hypothetical protein
LQARPNKPNGLTQKLRGRPQVKAKSGKWVLTGMAGTAGIMMYSRQRSG